MKGFLFGRPEGSDLLEVILHGQNKGLSELKSGLQVAGFRLLARTARPSPGLSCIRSWSAGAP